ncbi:MAG: hypothetical protein ACRCZK_04560 [Oscillospiraceae bacterium]
MKQNDEIKEITKNIIKINFNDYLLDKNIITKEIHQKAKEEFLKNQNYGYL